MKHLTTEQIDQLHAQQKAALNGIKNKYVAFRNFDRNTAQNMQPKTQDGRDYGMVRQEARPELLSGMRSITAGMATRKAQAMAAKPNWTRQGYMAQ